MQKPDEKQTPQLDLTSCPTEWKKSKVKQQKKALNHCFQKNFQYKHKNPYHHSLAEFDQFVLRDQEAEKFSGSWNTKVFGRQAPLHVEIGTGYGHFMLEFCQDHPHINFIGMDYRFKRSFQLAKKLAKVTEKNFCYLRAKAERLEYLFAENEIDSLYLFFPDPWPKKRHHKNRLFQPHFLKAAAKVLKPGGKFYVKTDHRGYFSWMKEVLQDQVGDRYFVIESQTSQLHEDFPDHLIARYQTKFEKIFMKKEINTQALVLCVENHVSV